jgi:hypothetical protein
MYRILERSRWIKPHLDVCGGTNIQYTSASAAAWQNPIVAHLLVGSQNLVHVDFVDWRTERSSRLHVGMPIVGADIDRIGTR